jgi:hypothetical protein
MLSTSIRLAVDRELHAQEVARLALHLTKPQSNDTTAVTADTTSLLCSSAPASGGPSQTEVLKKALEERCISPDWVTDAKLMYGSLYKIRNSIKFTEGSRQAAQHLIQSLKCERKKRKREARKVRGHSIVQQRCKSSPVNSDQSQMHKLQLSCVCDCHPCSTLFHPRQSRVACIYV